jgi:hypothetical protein
VEFEGCLKFLASFSNLNFILDASWQKAIAFSESADLGVKFVQHNKSDHPHPIA